MSDLTRYRPVALPPEPWTHEDNPEWIFVESHPEPYMLAPDSTLQDIADAWNEYTKPERANLARRIPALAALLDGLVNNES